MIRIKLSTCLLILSFCIIFSACERDNSESFGVLILGAGTGGTAAAIQSSRMGVKTLLISESKWIGGMLTEAGVSAIDGNHHMPLSV
jgi:alkyl hydroperoxide reductase subunit AhpF